MIKSIRIGPFIYSVKYVNGFISEHTTEDGNHFTQTGLIDQPNQEIQISNNTKPDYQTITLFHEIIHGILYNGGFKDQDQLESLIEAISIGFYGVLKNNPQLRKLIANNFKEIK